MLRSLAVSDAKGHGINQTSCEQRHEDIGNRFADQARTHYSCAQRLVSPMTEDERQDCTERGFLFILAM